MLWLKVFVKHYQHQLGIVHNNWRFKAIGYSLKRILRKYLVMKPYKVQLVQQLKPLNRTNTPHFANKQNCHIWLTESPHVVVEKPIHPQGITIWCGFQSGGIIGLFFFANYIKHTVTFN